MAEAPVRTGSLRRRVIVSVLALLLLVLLGMGLVVNVVLGDRLRSDLRQRVADRALFATALAGQQLTAQELADRLTGQGITATYADGDELVVGRDQPPPTVGGTPGVPPGRRPGPARATPTGKSVTVERVGELLRAEVTVDGATIALTANLGEIDRTMATLTRIELAAGGATVVLAALVLMLVVRVALAPLGKMTALAHRIRGGARGGRLHPTKPQTDLGRTATALDAMLDALERAEAEAQDAEARMRTFLADASHDLRTPIAGVINTAERLLQDSHSRVERERRLVSLVREAQRAGRLVDDLLLMTRLGTGTGQLEPALRIEFVALGRLVELAVERTALLAPRREVRAEVADAGWARCDRDAVERVLANLLGNARTATGEGDLITVRGQTIGDLVVVEVIDTGQGVPVADRERIFDRFVRLNPARSRSPDAGAGAGNAGLGLPIARALARAMGGDLVCAPADRGAVFRLTVPSEPPPEPFLELGQLTQWRLADSAALISIGSSPSSSRQRPV